MNSHHEPGRDRQHQASLEARARKCASCLKFGILVVAGQEVRLTRPEQKLVRQLRSTLHGQRRLAPDA